MDPKVQTSFIPKKPITQERNVSSGVSLFLLVSIIIFLISLGLSGWVFLEKKNLITKIDQAKKTIESNRSIFEVNTIESIILLDSRIKVANTLLEKHVAITPIFDFLQSQTLKSVRFKSFRFSSGAKSDSGQSTIKVDMLGQARDYRTVALQAEEFGKLEWRDAIKDPVFADLNMTLDGSVSFVSSMTIVPKFILYKSNLNQ